jgi:hypothetical protein
MATRSEGEASIKQHHELIRQETKAALSAIIVSNLQSMTASITHLNHHWRCPSTSAMSFPRHIV